MLVDMIDDDPIAKRLAELPEPDLTDPDNPEWTEEMFARARPAREVLGDTFIDAWEEARANGTIRIVEVRDA